MTKQQLQEIKKRAEKATPGPWENEDDRVPEAALPWRSTGLIWQKDDQSYQKPVCKVDAQKLAAHSPTQQIEEFEANADFIAHARIDIPALIDYIEKLERAIEKCKEQRNTWAEWYINTRDGRLVLQTENIKDNAELDKILSSKDDK